MTSSEHPCGRRRPARLAVRQSIVPLSVVSPPPPPSPSTAGESRTGARWYYCDARSAELMSRCTQSISNRQCDSMLAPTEPSIQRRGTKSQVILVVLLEEKIFLIKSYDAADKCMSFLTVQSLRQFIVGKLNFLSKLQLSSISEELVNLFSICAAIY